MTAVRRLSLVDTDAAADAAPPPGAVRVAIASTDLKALNAHFGSAPKFAVYDVTPSGWSFVEAVEFEGNTDGGGSHRSDGDDRITPKVDALAGCHLLFCLAIGGPAAAKAVAQRIHPIKAQQAPIDEVLEKVRVMLTGTPPPWLRKVLQAAGVGAPRPDFEDD
ncbi:nitrogen fixation protein NifX [Pleomorphomonas diazotrophica]|uniref:nitrogen fixation protein NifX n=1 Tax=Pleomorphomonas diazotrophica TaxID=1166257 RepID=UPI0008E5C190|nr:nitrogen fixation protein NifX [Pleomorphomonas diazotrophica]SFM76263.1 nitrogen fixation protein NifX [Pleomorphomonas diazotrophica]